jgi:hypothetical protein
VLNQITKEPIARALVATLDGQFATMTDDRGQFEYRMPEQNLQAGTVAASRFSGSRGLFQARKPGYLSNPRNSAMERVTGKQSEVTIYLVPESLIVGHVTVPGSEGEVRINVELYRREMRDGREHWQPTGTFMTWSDGEFRFSGLSAGRYRLITHEQMDQDPLLFMQGTQSSGYPPVYYPNTTDFSLASPIMVTAGATAQVNLTVERREYYPVRIPVADSRMGMQMSLLVYPMGHRGPGWSLGYNPAEGAIEGMLPNGNYTIEADTRGQEQSTGIMNFSVTGGAFRGPALNLIPNSALSVNIREEFRAGQGNVDSGSAEGGDARINVRQQRSIHVILTRIEDFNPEGNIKSQTIEGRQGREITFPSVRPGRYGVSVTTGMGYAASIQSGGIDLLHQPLVVGLGGGNAPIEVTLRDDGAEVSGTLEGATNAEMNAGQSEGGLPARFVYFLPVGDSGGQYQMTVSGPDGMFKEQQLAPGYYLVLAFEQVEQNLTYTNEEEIHALESKGQIIRVEAGQKLNLKLRTVARSDAP